MAALSPYHWVLTSSGQAVNQYCLSLLPTSKN